MNGRMTRRKALAALGFGPLALCAPARADHRALDAILDRRRMVRRFRGDPVSEAVVTRLLDTATRAPSAGNTQPWAFVVVRDEAMRRKLGRAALGQMWLAQAPVVVVPCADPSRAAPRYRGRAERYARIDTSFASLLLLLAVAEEGLGACFVGAFNDAEVAQLLRLPSKVQPLALIPIGYPDERPEAQPRRRLRDVVHRERWDAGT